MEKTNKNQRTEEKEEDHRIGESTDELAEIFLAIHGLEVFAKGQQNTHKHIKGSLKELVRKVRAFQRAGPRKAAAVQTNEAGTWTGEDEVFTLVQGPRRKRGNSGGNSTPIISPPPLPPTRTPSRKTTQEEPTKPSQIKKPPWKQQPQPLQQQRQQQQPQGRKDRRDQRQPRQRPLAVLIQPSEGRTYAETVKAVKAGIDPAKVGVTISSVKKTRKGEILLEITSRNHKDVATLAAAVTEGCGLESRALGQSHRLEIRDVEVSTTKEELIAELATLGHKEGTKVLHTIPDRRGTLTAIVELPANAARDLTLKGNIRIGWSVCRVRRRVELLRCFRCHCFGHPARRCTGLDRTALCYNCGESGHTAKQCKNSPRCAQCDPTRAPGVNHRTGSGACPAFRRMLLEANGKERATK